MATQRSTPRAPLVWLLLGTLGLSACSKKSGAVEPVGMPFIEPTAEANETLPAAAQAASGLSAVSLLPLEVGNTWTYQVTGSSPACTSGEHTRSIVRALDITGKQAFVSSPFCGNDEEAVFARNGSDVLQYVDGEWHTALAGGLAEERAWDFSADVGYRWREVGWVRVPAGLFADCWERTPRDDSWQQTFCDGAGMVSMTGVGLLVVLTSFNLNHGTLVSRPSAEAAPG